MELLYCLNTCKCDIRIVCFEMASLGGVLGGEVSYISHWARENNFFGEKICLKARYFLIFLVLNFFSLFVLMRCFWRPVKVNSSRLYDLSLIRFNFFDYICFLLCYLCGLFIEKLEPFFHLLGSLVCYVNILFHFCHIPFFF